MTKDILQVNGAGNSSVGKFCLVFSLGDVSNGRARQKQLLMSGLEMLGLRLGSQLEWISCWRVGRKPIRINMVRLDTTKGDIFICLSSRWMG